MDLLIRITMILFVLGIINYLTEGFFLDRVKDFFRALK